MCCTVAHFAKYTLAQTRQEINHDRRKYTAKRENVDSNLSHKNYNLAGHNVDPWQFVKDKIAMSKNSGGRFNSRSVAVVSCVVSLPADFVGNEHLFFETAKKHLDKVFGGENCVSAWVHYDEPGARPHLHYKATPVLQKNEAYQFNAKAIVSRSFLSRFHNDLERSMVAVFGHTVGITNGATKNGNLTVPQLKYQREQFINLNKDYISLLDEYNGLVEEYNELLDNIDQLEKKKISLQSRCAELRKKLDDLIVQNHRVADSVLSDDEFDLAR